jgi:hypothetical protein
MNHELNQKLAEIRNNMLSITQPQKETEVNTNQQTQPKTIQVRVSRSKNKSAQVRKLMREQPHLSAIDIAKIVGCKPHTVHNVKYNLKKKRKAKVVVAKPAADRLQKAIQTTQSQAKTFGHLVHLSPIKDCVVNLMLDAITSGNTDLVKNKHFQTLVKLTTTPETDQL